MRDEHERALELGQGDGQRLARLQVEVVGRLVEQQQVGAQPHDEREGEPRLLAAGEGCDRSRRHVAGEVEAPEIVAQLLLARVPCDAREVPERRFVVAQHLDLMLREIADREPLVEDRLAGERRELSGDGLDERRFPRAVDAEQAVALAALQREIDIAHDGLVRRVFHFVAGVRVFQHQERIGRLQRLAKLEGEGRGDVQGRELLHLREHLHAALRLLRLGGLRPEAVDEGFQVLALTLLLLVLRRSEHHRGRALALEARVVARVAPELLRIDVRDHVHHAVQEIAVVRNDEERPAIALEPLLEPEDGVEVEMVGRLIQQQEVRGTHQRLREIQTHAPAAGEARHGLAHLLVREAQAVQELLRARAHRVGVGVAHRGVELADPVAVIGGSGCGELAFEPAQRRIAVDRVFERGALERGRLLRDVGDAPARRVIDLALVGVQLAAQERKEARLPRAVRADQADLVAGIERDVGALEQRFSAAAERDLGEADHVRSIRKARIVRGRAGLMRR